MKTLVVLNDPPYGTERSYNALREELTDWTWADKVVGF